MSSTINGDIAKVIKPTRQRLVNNVLFNLSGQGLPLLAALFAIPLLIKALGIDRFGIFTLIWVVVGYFGLFDLGIARAMTKLVAERFGTTRENEIPGIFWTAIPVVLLSGLVGALILFTSASGVAQYILKASPELQQETLPAFYLLALSIPLVISIAGLTGFLEAAQRFGLINLVRIPMGVFGFLGPLLVLSYSHSLYALTAILLAGRALEFVALFILCLKVLPDLRRGIRFRVANIRPLLSFGGWITVSNVVGPFLTHLDRFFISALISVAAIAYYATPYSIITKLLIIPGALVGVLFPTVALLLKQNRGQAAQMFYRSSKYVIFAMFPLLLILITFAHEALALWLGEEFSSHGTVVLQWLVIGVFLNGLAQLPVALIHGNGRPELVAKLHLAELPIYLLALIVLLEKYGIAGVAMAGVARFTVDTLVLFLFARHLVPETDFSIKRTAKFVLVAIGVFILAATLSTLYFKVMYCLAILLIFSFWAWSILDAGEKKLLLDLTKK